MYKNHLKFLIATKTSLKFIQAELDQVRDSIRTWNNYSQKYDLYTHSTPIDWVYSQERPYKGDVIKGEHRMYLHVYFNVEKAVDDERNLHILLNTLQGELEEDVLIEAKRNYGYFVLLSNEIKDSIEAIEVYRNKDLVEKAFGNLKERLSFDRLGVSSDLSLDGKLFVEFVSLIYLSYIKKQMQDKNLFEKYTMQELLDEFDIIECFEQPERALRVSEITKRQIGLFEAMDIAPLVSLQ